MLRIGFHRFGLDKPTIDAWFGGMYRSFFQALEDLGCRVSVSQDRLDKDIDLLVLPMGGGQDKDSVKAMLSCNAPVAMNIGAAAYWFREGLLTRWKDRILFLYGTDRSAYSYQMAAAVGLPYHNLAFGSNPDVMHPLNLPKLYDVVFVGNADSGIGRHDYVRPLIDTLGDRNLLFLGSGWEKYGYPFQTVAWGKLLNILYNLSQVCINLSNDEQKKAGTVSQMDANNRLFDLAMAGCFQISNAPQLVRHYFDESEVVAIDSPTDWVDSIGHYLDHPDEMQPFRVAARERALADHRWENRAKGFVSEIESRLSARGAQERKPSRIGILYRLKDAWLSPRSGRFPVLRLICLMGLDRITASTSSLCSGHPAICSVQAR